MRVFQEQQEAGAVYTIFSDPTAAIQQICTDRVGPGQALARAVIYRERALVERGCSVTSRWPPAHNGVLPSAACAGSIDDNSAGVRYETEALMQSHRQVEVVSEHAALLRLLMRLRKRRKGQRKYPTTS